MSFQKKLERIIKKNKSLVCLGLDSDYDKLPASVKKKKYPQFVFNKAIISATADLVCAYKPNSAFYEARGVEGIKELKMTCDYLAEQYPDIPIILDAKRGDIGNTNNGYVSFAFDYLRASAITLHPYLGQEALRPFLDRKDKGCIILCKTSNKGSGEFQNLSMSLRGVSAKPDDVAISSKIASSATKVGTRNDILFYEHIAYQVAEKWNKNGNCMLVVGATYPAELKEIREIAGDMTFLVPGIGAQGGDIEATMKAGLNSKKAGMIINSSRGIILASSGTDFATSARNETEKLRTKIERFR